MDYIGTAERVLEAMRQLLSLITPLLRGSEHENTFIHQVYKFVQYAILILEKTDPQTKKRWNLMLDSFLSTAWLVVQTMTSEAAFNAVKRVPDEISNLCEGRIPKYMVPYFEELERFLATASEKLAKLQSTCYWLMEQVTKACECHSWNPFTVRRLEVSRLRALLDIRDCEQHLNSAHEIIMLIQTKTTEQAVKLGLGLAFAAAVTFGLGFGAVRAIQAGAYLRGGLLGGAGAGGAVACILVGKKLIDYKAVWDEVRIKRIQYRHVSTRLESIKATVRKDLETAFLLARILDLDKSIILLAFLAVFGMIVAYVVVN